MNLLECYIKLTFFKLKFETFKEIFKGNPFIIFIYFFFFFGNLKEDLFFIENKILDPFSVSISKKKSFKLFFKGKIERTIFWSGIKEPEKNLLNYGLN